MIDNKMAAVLDSLSSLTATVESVVPTLRAALAEAGRGIEKRDAEIERLRALVPSSQPETPTELRDSLGRTYQDRADAMTNEEAATWLDLIMLDGYRTSVHVAMRKVLKTLREPVVQDEAPKADLLLQELRAYVKHLWDECHDGGNFEGTADARKLDRLIAAVGASRPSPADRKEG